MTRSCCWSDGRRCTPNQRTAPRRRPPRVMHSPTGAPVLEIGARDPLGAPTGAGTHRRRTGRNSFSLNPCFTTRYHRTTSASTGPQTKEALAVSTSRTGSSKIHKSSAKRSLRTLGCRTRRANKISILLAINLRRKSEVSREETSETWGVNWLFILGLNWGSLLLRDRPMVASQVARINWMFFPLDSGKCRICLSAGVL